METISFVLKNISRRKLRTALTLLGIIIGIAMIIALISLGDSMKLSISNQLSQLGSERIMVIPKTSGGFGMPLSSISLEEKDLNTIKKVHGVEIVMPIIMNSLPVKYKNTETMSTVIGVNSKDAQAYLSDVQNLEIQSGRIIKENERFSVIIGSNVAKDIFEGIKINDKLTIAGKDVRVVGIMNATGSTAEDNAIIISIEGMKEITGKDTISYILVKANEDPKTVAHRIEDALQKLHGSQPFSVMTTEQLIQRIGNVIGIISLVFVGIAAISLLVAGFGIMNTMLMSVMERTREIGTMKAVGATNRRILSIFLSEAALVGFIGGAIGVVLGYVLFDGIIRVVSGLIGSTLPFVISPVLIAFALGFSVLVGVVSGLYPARRAAKLDPVEALRYE